MKCILKTIFALAVVFYFGFSEVQANAMQIPLRFDKYYSYAELNEALRLLAITYKDIAKVEVIGKSDENREILALIINNPLTGDAKDKPGVYVDGNIHGNEIQAGEVCLYTAQYLLDNYKKLDRVTKLVDNNAYYIIPVVNVDGRYHFMADANSMNSNRSVRLSKDDDRDGLWDEDGYDDLDGDGNICQMRIADPFGEYKPDPKDPRNMIKVKAGEKGSYSLLGWEGFDNDNDGSLNEDAEGYVDPNRNFPGTWQPEYIQQGAGSYPFESKSTKAIGNFIRNHPNIIISWAFHNSGGMFLSNPGDKGEVIPSSDSKLYEFLGKKAERIVPNYRFMPAVELYPTKGGFLDFLYYVAGSFGFVGELHTSANETFNGYKKSADLSKDQERLLFNDHVAQGALFKDWKPVKHPQYGDIEVGGWTKYSKRLTPAFMLPDLVHRNAMAVLFSASQTPNVKMEKLKVEKQKPGVYKVYIRLSNAGMIPSTTKISKQNNIHVQDYVKVEGATVIAGGVVTNLLNGSVNYKKHKPEVQFISVPGNDKIDLAFIVKGKVPTFKYVAQKAMDQNLSVTLY